MRPRRDGRQGHEKKDDMSWRVALYDDVDLWWNASVGNEMGIPNV